jgi:hypothetical protein
MADSVARRAGPEGPAQTWRSAPQLLQAFPIFEKRVALGWWAPCVWCAFGVAALVGGEVLVHTRYGGEAEPLTIPVVDARPAGSPDVVVHFAIPPTRAWDNVRQHCSLVLPFRSEDEIAAWCVWHGLPRGEAVPSGAGLEPCPRLVRIACRSGLLVTCCGAGWHPARRLAIGADSRAVSSRVVKTGGVSST